MLWSAAALVPVRASGVGLSYDVEPMLAVTVLRGDT